MDRFAALNGAPVRFMTGSSVWVKKHFQVNFSGGGVEGYRPDTRAEAR